MNDPVEDTDNQSLRALALPPRFDAFLPEVIADPYPTYARLRRSSALCRGGPGQWVVTRYADVAAFFSDPRLQNCLPPEYHALAVGNGAVADFMQRIVLYHDRPKHTRLRQLLGRSFDAAALRRLRLRVHELVEEALEPALQGGTLDVVSELALPLPIRVVCELIGLPVEDWRSVRPMAADLGRAFSSNVSLYDREAADAAVTWLRAYLRDKLRERSRDPREDLLSRLAKAGTADASITEDDVIDNATFLFFAGFETTSSLLSTGIVALSENPEQFAVLKAHPDAAPRAVEELLRYDAPIQSRLRLVREPIAIAGRTIRPGRLLLLLVGSANRDEHQFVDPDRLDLLRHPNPHLAFGGGDHFCLGAGLARIEGGAVFGQLAKRVRTLELTQAAERDMSSPFRTFARVSIAVRSN